jgi:hypothetical protein
MCACGVLWQVLTKQSHVLSFKKIQEKTENMMKDLRIKASNITVYILYCLLTETCNTLQYTASCYSVKHAVFGKPLQFDTTVYTCTHI